MKYFLKKLIYKLIYLNLGYIAKILIFFHNILNINFKIYNFKKSLRILGISIKEFNIYKNELLNDKKLEKKFLSSKKEIAKFNSFKNKIEKNIQYQVLYSLIRCNKIKNILTTGVADGSQEAIILSALHKNNEGNLISLDLPGKKGYLTFDQNLETADIGNLIPEEYKTKWNLILDDSRFCLANILKKNDFDMFIHDSNHTISHMNFEYATARVLMKNNSYIFSDDILIFNNAFQQFLEMNNQKGFCIYPRLNFGFMVNMFDDFETQNSIDNYNDNIR